MSCKKNSHSCDSWPLLMRWNWYIDTCHILLTYHGNYLEKLRKLFILVNFL
jgi:hypothetical protein